MFNRTNTDMASSYLSRPSLWVRLTLFFVFIILCFISESAPAQPTALAMQGMQLRLAHFNKEIPEGMGLKTIEVHNQGDAILLKWSSETRKTVAENNQNPWPEYRVTTTHGQIRTSDWKNSNFLFHPALWVEGSFNVEESSLLWFPLNHLQKDSILFEPGFLNASPLQIKKLTPALSSTLQQFQELASLTAQKIDPKDPDAKNLKKWSDFISTFTHVNLLSAKKIFTLSVNKQKKNYEGIVVGNAFVEYTVLNNPENPLVVELSFNSMNSPPEFRSLISFFQNNLGFKVTQIQTR